MRHLYPHVWDFLFICWGGDELHLYYEVGRTLFYLFFIFFAGGTLSQVQSTNNWYEGSNLTYALAYFYNLILNEATLR